VSFSRYALGLVLLVALVGSAAFGGLRLRQRLLPVWTGAPARLAEATIALGIVLGVAELLGTVGLFRGSTVIGGCILVGVGVGIAPWPRLQGTRLEPPAPPVPPFALALALAAAAFVLAQWAAGTEPAFNGGMIGADTLGYHGPIAASFVQRASIVHPLYVYSDPAVTFFPATSELVNAIGILLFSRDVLSPVINLAWLGLALLAAWCVGRPRGLGPASLLVSAVVLDTPIFSTSQPGSTDNDVVGLALLLTSLALLFNGHQARAEHDDRLRWPSAAVALAGIAAGLALGTKVTMFAPVGLLALAILIVLPGTRSRIAWVVTILAGSVVWFGRNLIAFGSPIPSVHLGIGALGLPWAKVPGTGFLFADSLTNGAYWQKIFLPGLHGGLTLAWPVILAVALVGAIMGLARGPTPFERAIGLVAILSAGAYALTPRTGFAFLFATNLRYLGPAIVIGTALVFRVPRLSSILGRPWVLVLLGAGVIIDVADHGASLLGVFPVLSPTPHLAGTAFMWAGIALAAVLTLLVLSGRRVAVSGGLVLLALAVAGLVMWPAERHYLRTRYTTGPLAFARSLHHQRIAIVGFLQPYAAYGLDLSNQVTEILHHGPHGAQTLVGSCQQWRRALSAGRYDYVVTSGPYGLLYASAPNYAAWTRTDPAASLISATRDGIGGTISVFQLHGPMHPNLCA
jgi:hypothetical protein